MANAVRFTTTELVEIEGQIATGRRARARHRAGGLHRARRCAAAHERDLGAPSPRRSPSSIASRASPSSPRREGLRAPGPRRRHVVRDRGGRHPVVEQALRKAKRWPLHRERLHPRPRRRAGYAGLRGRSMRPHLARHRPEHGGQIDVPAPERADRVLAQMGSFVPARFVHASASSTGCSRASAPPTTSRAAARRSWSRWSRRRTS